MATLLNFIYKKKLRDESALSEKIFFETDIEKKNILCKVTSDTSYFVVLNKKSSA